METLIIVIIVFALLFYKTKPKPKDSKFDKKGGKKDDRK